MTTSSDRALLERSGELRAIRACAENVAAAEAADALRGGGILAEARELRFLHPIIRWAIHEQLPLATRSAGHESAARMLAAALAKES